MDARVIKANEAKMVDNVNHPHHYEGSTSIECIDAMLIAFGRDAVIQFCKCNAFKYLWRFKNKNGKEDLDKAIWYCDKAKQLDQSEYSDDQLYELQQMIHIQQLTYQCGGGLNGAG